MLLSYFYMSTKKAHRGAGLYGQSPRAGFRKHQRVAEVCMSLLQRALHPRERAGKNGTWCVRHACPIPPCVKTDRLVCTPSASPENNNHSNYSSSRTAQQTYLVI